MLVSDYGRAGRALMTASGLMMLFESFTPWEVAVGGPQDDLNGESYFERSELGWGTPASPVDLWNMLAEYRHLVSDLCSGPC